MIDVDEVLSRIQDLVEDRVGAPFGAKEQQMMRVLIPCIVDAMTDPSMRKCVMKAQKAIASASALRMLSRELPLNLMIATGHLDVIAISSVMLCASMAALRLDGSEWAPPMITNATRDVLKELKAQEDSEAAEFNLPLNEIADIEAIVQGFEKGNEDE